MGCTYSPHTSAGLRAMDDQRLYHSKRKSSDIEKKARKLRRAVRKGLVDDATEKEGETYAAGAF